MPNTKTKKFDFQIFLAVSMILLVICCSVVCIVVGNTDNGVARAEYAPVTNPDFYTNTKFYLKNLNRYTREDVLSFVEYFAYGQQGIMDSTTSFTVENVVGYIWFDLGTDSKIAYLELVITQVSDFGMLSISLYLNHADGVKPSLFSFVYDYNNNSILDFSVAEHDGQANTYYEYDVTKMKDKTWSTTSLFGSGFSYSTINMLEFNFNSTSDLGCILSSSTSFSTIPVLGGGDTTELENQITDLQNQNTALQNQNTQLQTQLNEYQSYYDSIAWFDVLSSNLNNISTINIGGYKSNLIDVKANDGTGKNQVNVWNNESDSNTAFAIVMPRSFGNGTRFRFSYNGLIGSASGMANQPASLGYINSTGNLISLMELPTASSSYVEFNISEEVNTFVVYTSGNLIMFYDFRFQVFSLDVDSIYDSAYEDGVKHGYNTGYYTGKNEGIAQANDYSFFSLFSAVFDAPITAIVGRWGDSDGDGVYQREGGMLNFYIPGLDINFAPFLLSIFTLAIIVMIIRFILARKS